MKYLGLIFLLMVFTCAANAQETDPGVPKGTVSGIVKDEKGALAAGVQVFVYNGDTILGSGTTDESGKFLTNRIQTGTYQVRTVAPAHKKSVMSGVPVKQNTNTALILNIAPSADEDDTSNVYTNYAISRKVPLKKKQ